MVPDDLTQTPKFSCSFVLLTELESSVGCHLHVTT